MLLNASLLLLLPLLALAEVTPPTTVAVDEALHLLVFSILHVLKSIKSLATLPAVVIVALITPISMQPAPNSSRYHDSSSTHHLTNDLSNLSMRAEEYAGSDQIRVGNGQGLQIHHTSSTCLPSKLHKFFLQFLLHVPHIQKNLIPFINSLTIIMSLLSFIHLVFVLRTFSHESCSSKARVKMASTRGLLLQSPCHHPLKLFLVSESLSISGKLGWATLHYELFVRFFLNSVFLSPPIKQPLVAPPANKENYTSFIFLSILVFQHILWICFFLMYGALLLFFHKIINIIFIAFWMIIVITLGYFLFHANLKSSLCLLHLSCLLKTTFVPPSNMFKQMTEVNSFQFNDCFLLMAYLTNKLALTLTIKMGVLSGKYVTLLIMA
jgi:hypothetical protein